MTYKKIIFIAIISICNLVIFGFSESVLAAEYYVSPSGDDANNGSILTPFRTFDKGLQTIQNGDTLFARAGTYRIMEENTVRPSFSRSGATENNYVTIQNYNNESVKILGSLSTENKTWESYGANLYRLAADYLVQDPTGLHQGEERIEHIMKWVDGDRSHGDASALIVPGTWTKADASGVGCGSSNNACYIYLYPTNGNNPNGQIYELAQRGFFWSSGTSYLKIKGLQFAYTQNAAFIIEGGRGQIIEDNVFSHNSYGNDNSYSFFISYGGGVVVRGNTVFDSEYWGGTPNSKGITFMDMDPNDPSIVEDNEVYNIIGQGICTKSGVSNLIVRRNYVHDTGSGIETPGPRCHWTRPDCVSGDPEFYPGGSWQIYENKLFNNVTGISFLAWSEANGTSNDNIVYNNIFYRNSSSAINFFLTPTGNTAANNIFIQNGRAIYLNAGSDGIVRSVEDFLPNFSSNNNLFYENTNDYFLRPNWEGSENSGIGYTLGQIKSNYLREPNSVAGDPLFVNLSGSDFHLNQSSPARNGGDGSYYNLAQVDMGIYPSISVDTIPPLNPQGLSVM